MKITIEKGIEMPRTRRVFKDSPALKSLQKFTHRKMNVGESICIPLNGLTVSACRKVIKSWNQNRSGMTWKTKLIDDKGYYLNPKDSHKEAKHIRIWRVS